MRKKKKEISNSFGLRRLKVQTNHRVFINRSDYIVPEIILKGKWLEELGFKKESRVIVHTSNKMVIIRPEE